MHGARLCASAVNFQTSSARDGVHILYEFHPCDSLRYHNPRLDFAYKEDANTPEIELESATWDMTTIMSVPNTLLR